MPANEIVGLLPGELFVRRNVANLVLTTDLNGRSAIQFAVDSLRARHITLSTQDRALRSGGHPEVGGERPRAVVLRSGH